MIARPKKRSVGRPALPAGTQRRPLNISLAPDTLIWLDKAQAAGWPSISAYLERLVMRDQIAQPRGPAAPEV